MKNTIVYCIVLIVVFTICISCSSLIKAINGEKKPQLENYESIRCFLEDNEIRIDLERTFFFSRQQGIEALYSFKPYNVQRVSNPDIYLFDENLFLIDDLAIGGCIYDRPAPEEGDYYSEIYKVNKGRILTSSLKDLKGSLINYKGEPFFPFEENYNDKTIIIVWSKYKGVKFVKSQVDYTLETLQGTSEEIQLYFLNVDDYQYL